VAAAGAKEKSEGGPGGRGQALSAQGKVLADVVLSADDIWHLTQGSTTEGAHQDLETICQTPPCRVIRMSLLDALGVVEGKLGRRRRSRAGRKARCRR
jgi:hypothetical protein